MRLSTPLHLVTKFRMLHRSCGTETTRTWKQLLVLNTNWTERHISWRTKKSNLFFLLSDSPASEFYVPTFRYTTSVPSSLVVWANTAYEYGTDSFPKRRNIKFRRPGVAQKKEYNIQITAKVWNQGNGINLTSVVITFFCDDTVQLGTYILNNAKIRTGIP